MRVTNSMILKNSSTNINGTKTSVSTTSNQMTTQKKISKPSDDPVTAIRSLRLSTNLSKLTQYSKNNIPDAQSWLDVTETALINMKGLITDFRTQCVNGATGTLTASDRDTILQQLKALQQQIYSEGNADYAGRTVFTGYRTNQSLTFTDNETNTYYNITQKIDASKMDENNYYTGNVEVPKTVDEVKNNTISDTVKSVYNRIRLPYELGSDNDTVNSLNISYKIGDDEYGIAFTNNGTSFTGVVAANKIKDNDGNDIDVKLTEYEDEDAWLAASGSTPPVKELADDEIVIIRSTGEMVFGEKIASALKQNEATIDIDYDKTGFKQGELRPEYYYDCVDKTNASNPPASYINYKKFDDDGKAITYDIEYTVANNQTMVVNTEASEVFDSEIIQDINDMIDIVNKAVDAHAKVDNIKSMMEQAQYASTECQEKLTEWLAAAQKEADFADANLTDVFSKCLGNADTYLGDITLSITDLGCKVDQLKITENRVTNQKETVEELQSQNDDLDLSEIIIKYTAAYTAYQASLQAAGKLGQLSLLNYI